MSWQHKNPWSTLRRPSPNGGDGTLQPPVLGHLSGNWDWLGTRASHRHSRRVGSEDAPALDTEAKGALVGARRGRLPGRDAPNFPRPPIPISLSGLLLQPIRPPDAAQRGGRERGRNPWTRLRAVPRGAPAWDPLQPLHPGSRVGNPRGLRLRATGTQHRGSIWGGTTSASTPTPRVLAVGGLRSAGQRDRARRLL